MFHLKENEQQVLKNTGVLDEAAEIFKYGQEDGYWDGAKVVNQVWNKALPIVKALYPGYKAIFMFDNAKSYAIFAKNALRLNQMSKDVGDVQPFIRDGWYKSSDNIRHSQPMWYLEPINETTLMEPHIQKKIQRILDERGLWLDRGLRLECPTPKCGACIDMVKCKDCVRARRCDSCKEKKITAALSVLLNADVMHVSKDATVAPALSKGFVLVVAKKPVKMWELWRTSGETWQIR